MKTAKLVIGIISIVLTGLIMFQSCAAGIGEALSENGGSGGMSGTITAVLMLISGIVAIAARKSRGGAIFCTVLYAIAGIIAVTGAGIYTDLYIWGGLCFLFGVIFLISVITFKKENIAAENQEVK